MSSMSQRLAWWCSLTILLSAFLLFQVQPVISKMILPWFGGSPAVWTTCMLFFQLVLLAGYAYAHWLSQDAPPGRQVAIHLTLLAAAILLLPIIPATYWKPTGSENPTLRILVVLAATVGLPYLLLSATGPLVQSWFTRVCPNRSPYWLYALSNVGSLAALLSYPFLVEPAWTSRQQGVYWSMGFTAFALACGGLAVKVWQVGRIIPTQTWDEAVAAAALENAPLPPVWQRLSWVALPALGCVALLSTTNHLCQDVAVVPFLWVVPLSFYLISFILAFAGNWAYPRRAWLAITALSILAVAGFQRHSQVTDWITARGWIPRLKSIEEGVLGAIRKVGGEGLLKKLLIDGLSLEQLNENIVTHVGVYLLALFAICMMCHGELARLRPPTRYLTRYFLMSSAGGALGGVFVALICPVIFKTYMELHWMYSTACLVVLGVWCAESLARWKSAEGRWKWFSRLATPLAIPALIVTLWLVVISQRMAEDTNDLDTARSFYGVLHVEVANEDNPAYAGLELLNGRILHGYQILDESLRRTPTTYYTRRSGVGLAVESLRELEESPRELGEDGPPGEGASLRVAVVGLGVGTMAAYGQVGDHFRFYEINPQVERFAREHFFFLSDCPAECDVVLGDARLSLEREEPQAYHLIALDAFSGDAIPVHLLTRECFDIYLGHLQERGVIAIHVSNRHLDLIPVVARLCEDCGLDVRIVQDGSSNGSVECTSDWMLVTRDRSLWNHFRLRNRCKELSEAQQKGPLWTDQFSNLLDILK